uniref:Uncharacterized protein n=1 Tax=Romanomermis culicivorax TaxID=13658 RepID=A0A915JRW1_ROMCU
MISLTIRNTLNTAPYTPDNPKTAPNITANNILSAFLEGLYTYSIPLTVPCHTSPCAAPHGASRCQLSASRYGRPATTVGQTAQSATRYTIVSMNRKSGFARRCAIPRGTSRRNKYPWIQDHQRDIDGFR